MKCLQDDPKFKLLNTVLQRLKKFHFFTSRKEDVVHDIHLKFHWIKIIE